MSGFLTFLLWAFIHILISAATAEPPSNGVLVSVEPTLVTAFAERSCRAFQGCGGAVELRRTSSMLTDAPKTSGPTLQVTGPTFLWSR